jgi:DNA-binding beta-propeller fold protein YncE
MGCVSWKRRDGCAVARGLRGGHATISPDDRELYVASASYGRESVLTFSRDAMTGALTQFPGPDGCASDTTHFGCRRAYSLLYADAVALSPDGAWAYVAAGSGGVAIFARSPFDGRLIQPPAPFGCVSSDEPGRFCRPARLLGGADDVLVTPDGRFVYVAAFHHGVVGFRRDPQTGLLKQLPGRSGCVSTLLSEACRRARGIRVTAGDGTDALSLSRDGRTLYASSPIFGLPGTAIAVLRRDPASGALRALPGTVGCIGYGRGCRRVRGIDFEGDLSLSPDGRFAFVPDDGPYGGVAVFRVVGQ